jgi:signal transduction histidine kinase
VPTSLWSSARRATRWAAPALIGVAVGLASIGAYVGIWERLPREASDPAVLVPPDLAPTEEWQHDGAIEVEPPVSGWGDVLILRDPDDLPRDPFYPVFLIGPWVAVWLAVAIAFAVAFRRRSAWPLLVVTLLAWFVAGMWPAVMLLAYEIAMRERRTTRLRWAAAAGTVVTGGPIVLAGLHSYGFGEAWVAAVLVAGALVAFPMLAGLWLSTRHRLIAELRERVTRAEVDQQARAEQARAEERARLTREMHDVIAHRVSLMVLHAGGVEVSSTDERSARAGALIRATGREALTELRDMLGVLSRPPGVPSAPTAPVPTLAHLDRVLEQARAAGIRVVRCDRGDFNGVPSAVGRTAYRVVREALTNVARHAGHTDVQVVLDRRGGALLVRVHNAAPAHPPAAPPVSGFGLVGIRERVELLGGTLTAGPVDGGFTVQAVLPLPPPAAAGPTSDTAAMPEIGCTPDAVVADAAGVTAPSGGRTVGDR